MSSPSNNAFPIKQYLSSNNEPKTLFGTQISVAEWQRTSLFSASDPNLLPTSFVDKETNKPLNNEKSSFGGRTPMPSPPSTPKPKGKAKEVENDHQDPMSDDIYEEEKSPGLSQPKPTLDTEKVQDNLAIGMAGLSGSPASNLSGPSQRLAAIQEALQAICHEPHPSLSCPSLKPTTAEPHLTMKEPACMPLSYYEGHTAEEGRNNVRRLWLLP